MKTKFITFKVTVPKTDVPITCRELKETLKDGFGVIADVTMVAPRKRPVVRYGKPLGWR